MASFTPYTALIGGTLIGLSVVLLLLFNGKIAGISGIFYRALDNTRGDKLWRWCFLAGLLMGAWLSLQFKLVQFDLRENFSFWLLAVSGFLVGFGTYLSNGCTSGHGVCGVARLSIRSIVAVCTFMGFAMISVFLVRHYWSF